MDNHGREWLPCGALRWCCMIVGMRVTAFQASIGVSNVMSTKHDIKGMRHETKGMRMVLLCSCCKQPIGSELLASH